MKVTIGANGIVHKTLYVCEVPSVPEGLTYCNLSLSSEVEKQIKVFFKSLIASSVIVTTGMKLATGKAFAASNQVVSTMVQPMAYQQGTPNVDLYQKLLPIIHLVQEFALPVGIIVSTWGMIEIMIGNPGGRQKMKFALIGYAGIFLIPIIFKAIHDALSGFSGAA